MTTNSTPGSPAGSGPNSSGNSGSQGSARRGGRSQGRNRRRPRGAGSPDQPGTESPKPVRAEGESAPAPKDRTAGGSREGGTREGGSREGRSRRSGDSRRRDGRPAAAPGAPGAAQSGAKPADSPAGPNRENRREGQAGNRNRRNEPRGEATGQGKGRGEPRGDSRARDGRPADKGPDSNRNRGVKSPTGSGRPAPRRVEEELEPQDLTDWRLSVHGYEVWLCFQRVLPWTSDERELRAYIVDIYAEGREIDPLLLPALEDLKRIECVGRTMAAATAGLRGLLEARITELAVISASAYLEIAPPAPEILRPQVEACLAG